MKIGVWDFARWQTVAYPLRVPYHSALFAASAIVDVLASLQT
jgi:hypothetical protein